MRCRSCDYPLWTIRARVCPECGDPFYPSDFEFTPNSVRFCCPHCDQPYFGTGVRGHLEPPDFNCVKCGNRITMDGMVLVPREGVEEHQTEIRRLPWSDRRRGFFSRFFTMVGWGMGRPGDIGRGLPHTMTVSSSLGFTLLIWLCGVVFGVGVVILVMALALRRAGPGGLGVVFGGALLVALALGLLAWIVGLSLWALLTHWFIGGGRNERVTIGRTMQVLCLTSGPMILGAVPCLGPYGLQQAGMIWWIISAAIALRALHGCSGVRAAFATLIPPMIPIVLAAAWFFVMTMNSISAASRYSSTYQMTIANTQRARTARMAYSIASEVMFRGGSYPRHAVEMLRHGSITPATFYLYNNTASAFSLNGGGSELFNFVNDQQAVDDAIAALPADVIAHRVGDYVFTWHGLSPSMNGDLWVAVLAPASATAPGGTPWWAIEIDGDVTEIDPADHAAALLAQNRLRSSAGLAALPSPDLVAPDQPATPGGP